MDLLRSIVFPEVSRNDSGPAQIDLVHRRELKRREFVDQDHVEPGSCLVQPSQIDQRVRIQSDVGSVSR